MNTEVLHQDKHLNIEYIPSQHALIMIWEGYTNDDIYREAIDRIIDFMEKYDITKTLHDVSKHKGISPEAQEYATKRSLEFSQKNWNVKRALVLSKDIFAKFSTENFVKTVTEKGENQHREFFESLEDAKKWLFDV